MRVDAGIVETLQLATQGTPAPILGVWQRAGADAVRQGGAVAQRARQEACTIRRAAAVEGAAGAGAAARIPRQRACRVHCQGSNLGRHVSCMSDMGSLILIDHSKR